MPQRATRRPKRRTLNPVTNASRRRTAVYLEHAVRGNPHPRAVNGEYIVDAQFLDPSKSITIELGRRGSLSIEVLKTGVRIRHDGGNHGTRLVAAAESGINVLAIGPVHFPVKRRK
jgi:hypothetical protein